MRILDEFAEHWQIYLSMPLVAAVIGYLTKRAAIEMMFRPLRFVGIREPFLGWQGVVPRNSARMIRVSAELLTGRLVDPKEIFGRIDPDRLSREIELPLLLAVEQITRDVLDRYRPGLWTRLPPLAQELVVKRVQAAAPALVRRVLTEIREDIDEFIDVKEIAVTALTRDTRLLVSMIRDISRPEMAFIARCGVYFGLILGLVQTVVWAVTKNPIVLPLFGAGIGWLTDWLAIKLVFFPRERRKILGIVSFQGVFQRRRDQVAKEYGTIVAREVMTVPNIVDAVLHGPRSAKLTAVIRRAVTDTIDEQAGISRQIVGTRQYGQLRTAAADQAMRYLPSTILAAEAYATKALDVRDTIATKMRRLTRVEYEGLLRPAFRQDEWKLVAVGAVIGGLIGELQVLLLLH
jgi:uncharacterized membrane protein YheB (UPF0754 family)